jgi:RNA polymerase sigma-70 factor, ECF subfamily
VWNEAGASKTVTDDELYLIRKAQLGDGAAFARLVETYLQRVHRLALRFCRNSHDAEDLSQEVWIKAHKSIKNFRGEAAFYTWLRQILINTFLSHRPKAETVTFDELIYTESTFYDAERKILADKVREVLAEHTPQQRLMFLLKHEEGMTYDEIAAALNCSSGTVKKSVFRTIHKLRQRFGVNLNEKVL